MPQIKPSFIFLNLLLVCNKDLEEESDDEGDQCNSWFRKEIMNVLKQPYSEKEFKELEHEASLCRWLIKSKELLDGRDFTYTTNQKKPSYLDQYPGLLYTISYLLGNLCFASRNNMDKLIVLNQKGYLLRAFNFKDFAMCSLVHL